MGFYSIITFYSQSLSQEGFCTSNCGAGRREDRDHFENKMAIFFFQFLLKKTSKNKITSVVLKFKNITMLLTLKLSLCFEVRNSLLLTLQNGSTS